jgi:riboflavin biosynthesis pyrimidine reductase
VVAPFLLPVADPSDPLAAEDDLVLPGVSLLVPGLALGELLGALGAPDVRRHLWVVELHKERKVAFPPGLDADDDSAQHVLALHPLERLRLARATPLRVGALVASGGKDVFIMGGADVIRQALRARYVEKLSISIAPVVLGGGKRLLDDFDETVSLKHLRLLQSPFATHITYRVVR